MGYDSMSRVVDADGRFVVQFGTGSGDQQQRASDERVAAMIVTLVNGR